MNKYVFREYISADVSCECSAMAHSARFLTAGADASASLGWVINKVEGVGFEVQNIDVLGVHYSATIWRWYKNWLVNKDKVLAKYGERWFRIWAYFLASSVIIARQGGSSLFQITLHKNVRISQLLWPLLHRVLY